MEPIFWISLCLVAYVYAGYPILAAGLGAVVRRDVRKANIEPMLTVCIAAYNEEDVIEATIHNKLEQDYPADKLEVLVVSDGSTDETDAIVTGIDDPRVRLVRQEPRGGKTSGLNLVVPEAKGEIIVFSDANSLYAPDALRRLAANFADPEVGYVTGTMVYTDAGGTMVGDGCTAYMKYENGLRGAETRLGSVVGVDGGIDAVRRTLYRPMRPDQLPDFVLPLQVVDQGYRVVYEPLAVLREPTLKEAGDEYRMRVRVSLRALWALFDMRHLLAFTRSPLFAWQLWSHKVLRYACFLFLAVAWVSNLLLWNQGALYRTLFVLQNAAYAAALALPALERISLDNRLFTLARYFTLLNLAAGHAFLKFLMGKKQVVWTPRKG